MTVFIRSKIVHPSVMEFEQTKYGFFGLKGALWLKTINKIGHYYNSHSVPPICGRLLKFGMKQVFDSMYQLVSELDHICVFLVNY